MGYNVYGFSLGYFTGDYSNINGLNPVASDYGLNSWDLYNGNISRIKGFNLGLNGMSITSDTGMAYRYRYDQLNRLTGMNAATYLANGTDTTITYTTTQNYGEHVGYDPNGNIQSYFRNGTTANSQPLAMDSLSYKYQSGNNRLDHVNDPVPASNYSVDIDNEDTLNYQYDQIGNLTKDSSGGIDSIYWTVYGKIQQINKYNGDTIRFHYDPSGNRIAKEMFKDSLHRWIGTYYTHDATGNIMSTYHWYNKDTFDLDELVMYGSSRLGTIGANQYLTDTITRDSLWYIGHTVYTNPLCDSINYDATGLKQYEFTNHLGNVLVTLTDKHIPFYFGSFAFYIPEVASAQDYYPFGMEMVGRAYNPKLYRFGFNNKEKDDEVYGIGDAVDFEGRNIYSSRLGKFVSVDPRWSDYPSLSSYCYAANSPIRFIDEKGEGVLDVVGGYVIGVVTSVTPPPLSYAVRELGGQVASDKNDYNRALAAADGQTMALGEGLGGTGTAAMAVGGSMIAGGAAVSATGVGVVAGGPVAVAGAQIGTAGAITAGTGLAVMANSTVNKVMGYNYGKSAQTHVNSEQTKDNTDKQASKANNGQKRAQPYSKARPSYATGQENQVWESSKGVDGKVRDPNTGEELKWDINKARKGQWDMGHKPGAEYKDLKQAYLDGKISKEEFLSQYRDASKYQAESPKSNRSRKFEKQ